MPDEGDTLEAIRLRLIQLLEDDRGYLTERETVLGYQVMRRLVKYPTEYSIYNHIIRLLRDPTTPIRTIGLGEPPGSGGFGYVIKDPVFPSLYIKVKIEDEGYREARVWVLSFHNSKHGKGP